MNRRVPLIAAAGGLALVCVLGVAALAAPRPAPAPQAAKAKPMCFFTRDIDGVSVAAPDESRKQDGVYIRLNNKKVYHVAVNAPCFELENSVRLGIESRNVTGSICNASDVVVISHDPGTGLGDQCWGVGLHELTPDELAAVPAKERP